ncbi:MAG: hypothetical protein LIP28_02420, partial [Deltaproteobacteria bacterium]|nr:hypothetical protein [Deltaproteobacteria bacterium]
MAPSLSSSAVFSRPGRRRVLPFLLLALCLAAQPCAAAPDLPLPPPIDELLDVLLGVPPNLAPGNSLSAPARPQIRKARPKTPRNVMPIFLGIPYRKDGIINDAGKYATFNAPDVTFQSPGLNCSGLVLAASRIMLEKNIALSDAVRYREGQSGTVGKSGDYWHLG